MKKIISLSALMFSLTFLKVSAQTDASFSEGTNALNVGIGFLSSIGYFGGVASLPSVSVSLDHGIKNNLGPGNLGIGGIIGFKTARYKYAGTNYVDHWSDFIIAARATYYPTVLMTKDYNVYGAFQLGIRSQTYKSDYYNLYPSLYINHFGGIHPYASILVGGRYYFTPNIGGFAEIGYDIAYLKAGLTAKF